MEIHDKHEITWDHEDGSETKEFAATFYLTESDVALIAKFLDFAIVTPAAKFHKDWHKAKKFRDQLKRSLQNHEK